MASSDAGKYTYNIERLIFRNKAAIKLPKSGDFATLNRETCYKIAVDIVIESITKPDFRNFKTTPYHGYYGYATLVMRDCIAPKIELEFGRNRIFEQRIVEAFEAWNSIAFWLQTEKRFLELLANTVRVGDPPSFITNLCDYDAIPFNWSEIDLREVYVNCTEDTQFRIELSWVSPLKFTDNCGVEHDGKSNEPDDPTKDNGLPSNGTQPKKNSPANPFGGNKPVSNMALSPYLNEKGEALNNPDPENSDVIGQQKRCSVVATGTWKYPNSGNPIGNVIGIVEGEVLIPDGDSFEVEEYADETSYSGFSQAVRVMPSNQYWVGGELLPTRTRFTQEEVTVVADCTLPL